MSKAPTLREAKARGIAASLPSLELRLPVFIGCGVAPAKALAGLCLVFVGAGSVGLHLINHCARLAPAEITIADPKSFKVESLLTHPIQPGAVGRAKADYAASLCKQISPVTRVRWLEGPVQQLPFAALADADMVFMATDNLQAEVETGQLCRHLGRPLMQASVFGPTLSANVRFFANGSAEAACPACAFNTTEWAQLNTETLFSCEGGGNSATPYLNNPVSRSVSFLCSTVADLAMTQFLRHHLKLGAPVADTNLEYCGYTHRSFSTPLALNPNCPCDHTPYTRSSLPRPLVELTPRELIEIARLNSTSSSDGTTLTLDGLCWLERGVCACSEARALRRFAPPGRAQAGRCGRCGKPVRPQPFFSHQAATMPLLAAVLDRPLHQLGAGRAQWALVRCDDHAVLLLNQP